MAFHIVFSILQLFSPVFLCGVFKLGVDRALQTIVTLLGKHSPYVNLHLFIPGG